MCGIAGFLQQGATERREAEAIVEKMAQTLAHRGPDDAGAWVDEPAGLALGFRRLSIIDLSPAARQPMVSANSRYVVVYNGEIYNYRDLRNEIEKAGVSWRSASDTEVLLECTAHWGAEATFPRLWGMFAIALWDRGERTLYLARDRVGKKPLYYTDSGGLFLFASELKALRAHAAFKPEIDRNALAAYLRYGYVPAPYSIYKSVRKLLPGHYAVVRAGRPAEIHSYWDALEVISRAHASPAEMAEEEAVCELESLLRDAVGRRMIADVPLGALLSGGVDSSAVVALMQEQSTRPVKTFTIGFSEAGYNEAEAAKAIAKHLRTDHTELYVTPNEAQSIIPRLPQLYDEPFADSSEIPTALVCQMAKQYVTVCLSGDGGDEVFGGYTRYLLAQRVWSAMRLTPLVLRRIASGAIRRVPAGAWDALYRIIEPLMQNRWRQSLPGDKAHKLAHLLESPDQDVLYRNLVSLWKRPNEIAMEGCEPKTLLDDKRVRTLFPDFTERMMFLDLATYLPNDILVKVDRASMGVSLENRSPMLDHRVIEWAWRLPKDLKRRNGQSKWLLRQVLYRYVPRQLVERPKMGFGVPLGEWLRGSLRDWAEALIAERRLRQEGFLRPAPIRALWADHLTGKRKEEYRMWAVLMFQSWLEGQRNISSDR